jgi:hypothetical protein
VKGGLGRPISHPEHGDTPVSGIPGPQYLQLGPEYLRLTIPNPHSQDIAPALLTRILRQAGISREEWLND